MKQSIAHWFRRLLRRPWTPFDSNGNLRPELSTHEGWTVVGAMTDDSPQQPVGFIQGPVFIRPAAKSPWWRRLLRRFGR